MLSENNSCNMELNVGRSQFHPLSLNTLPLEVIMLKYDPKMLIKLLEIGDSR